MLLAYVMNCCLPLAVIIVSLVVLHTGSCSCGWGYTFGFGMDPGMLAPEIAEHAILTISPWGVGGDLLCCSEKWEVSERRGPMLMLDNASYSVSSLFSFWPGWEWSTIWAVNRWPKPCAVRQTEAFAKASQSWQGGWSCFWASPLCPDGHGGYLIRTKAHQETRCWFWAALVWLPCRDDVLKRTVSLWLSAETWLAWELLWSCPVSWMWKLVECCFRRP